MNIKPSNYIIGIIVFLFFIVGGISIMSLFQSQNPNFISDSEKFNQFNKSFNQYNELTNNIGSLDDGLSNTEIDEGTFGVLGSLINSAWSTLKILPSTLGFMSNTFDGLNTVLGIPKWVGTLIGMFIIVIIVFAIWGAIFQRDL